MAGFQELSLVIYQHAINKCVTDAIWKNRSFQRAPAALIQNVRFIGAKSGIGICKNQVGMITLPDEPSLPDIKTYGYGMTHLFHHFFYRELAFLHIFQHEGQGMLYQR